MGEKKTCESPVGGKYLVTSQEATQPTWIHLTAYQDELSILSILERIRAQSKKPDLIRIIDNSTLPLQIHEQELPVQIEHQRKNIGTAGAINQSIELAQQHEIEYLWILDQDSEPTSNLLEELTYAHQQLAKSSIDPVGIIAPLTRNQADGQINVPMRWNRFKPEKIFIGNHIIQAELLPAAGMLVHIPSIKKINLPSNRYFLDCYDFALGLAVKEVGASVCVVPSLELSHQVSQKVPITTEKDQRLVTDMPAHRVKLQHRNTTYLATRNSKGIYRLAAVIHQGIKASKHARRIRRNKLLNWEKKSHAALHGWLLGLFSLPNAHSRK